MLNFEDTAGGNKPSETSGEGGCRKGESATALADPRVLELP